jgi:hypothetical protein
MFRLILLRTTTGTIVATSPPIADWGRALAVDPAHHTIYAARDGCSPNCRNNGIVVVDARSGRPQATPLLNTSGVAGMFVSGSTLFIAGASLPGYSTQSLVIALALPSGKLVWVRAVGPWVTGFTVDATTRRLFVTASTLGTIAPYSPPAQPSTVIGIDLPSGRQVFSTTVGYGAVHPVVDPAYAHHFVLNSGDNSVSMLDARSGRVLVTTPVGDQPTDLFSSQLTVDQPVLAVDTAAGRVIVVNGLGGSISILDAATGRPLPGAGT